MTEPSGTERGPAMCDDNGACGECERFGNDPEIMDGILTEAFTALGDGDETDPIITGRCPFAVESDPMEQWIAEDTPACEHKVECCPENAAGIIACWLVENGYGGLLSADKCGCDVDDIAACGCIRPHCVPAHVYHCEWCLDAKICQVRHRGFSDEPYTTYSEDPELCHPNYMPPFTRGGFRK